MSYVDSKYIHLLSSQLGHFKRKSNDLYNFRCPYCGDSQSNKNKARGYVFQKEGSYIFKCHNCGQGASLSNLIKYVDPEMHKQYVAERFVNKDRKETPTPPKKTPLHKFQRRANYLKTPLGKLKKISQLQAGHPVRNYVNKRKIPTDQHYKLFYAPKFYEFVNTMVPNKVSPPSTDEPRLVIPFLDSSKNLIGFQGRAFGKSQPKYITIMLDEESLKVYGMDSVDWRKPVAVVEGPIDSMFLDNAIAMAGADVSNLESLYGNSELVYVYDNEPRNVEIVRRIDKAIEAGKSVVIFPNNIKEKDINDMILAGMPREEIQAIISNNTFSGLMAKTKLSEWRKV
jgi:hypothetical protein